MPVNTGPVDFRSLLESLVSGGNIPRNQTRVGEFVPGGRAQGPSFPAQGNSPGFLPSAFLTGNQLANQSLGRSIAPGSPEAFLDEGGEDPGVGVEDPGPPGTNDYTSDVNVTGSSLANFGLGMASPALGFANTISGRLGGPTIGDLFSSIARDPSMMDFANDPVDDLGIGPGVSSFNSPFGSFSIDSRNLDAVGGLGFDFSEYGYGLQGIQNALNGVTAAEAAGGAGGPADAGFGEPGGFGDFGEDLGENVGEGGGGDVGGTNENGSSSDDESGGACIISTALTAMGDWDRKKKLKAVRWCRDKHHDGSLRGEIWVDGYHCWGAKFVKMMKKYPWFKQFGLRISTAYLNQITGEKQTVLGFATWLWVTPLSYIVGAARKLV